jgi:hypothetical protein
MPWIIAVGHPARPRALRTTLDQLELLNQGSFLNPLDLVQFI